MAQRTPCGDAHTYTQTGWTRAFRWTGALPGLYFPRVAVGTYKARTTVWCAGVRKIRKQTVTIEEKTLEKTMSRGEFESVELGVGPVGAC